MMAYLMKKLFDFLKQINTKIDKDVLLLLTKQKMKKPVIFEKDGKLEYLSDAEFEKIFDVEYISNLHFETLKQLKTIYRKCKKSLKKGDLAEKEIWLGTYFEEEIINGKSPKVYIKWINEYKGYGLFALQDLEEGSYIGEYAGILRKYKRRLDIKNSFCFEYPVASNQKYTIDAKYMGNQIRFVNHSKSPNLIPHLALCKNMLHVILRASEFIPKGSELTYDYGPKYWQKREKPL